MEGLKILTFNCQGLQKAQKRAKVFHWLKTLNMDIIMLQETHCSLGTKDKWVEEWKGTILFSHGETNSRGCCILFRENMDMKIKKDLVDPFGRYILCDIELDLKILTIINTYGPNKDDSAFFNNIYELCEDYTGENIIWGGDFNVVQNPYLDKKGGILNTHTRARKALHNIMEQLDLEDIWRTKNPTLRRYTWHSNTKPIIQCRLDYFLTNNAINSRTGKCTIKPGYNSDHSAVEIEIKIVDNPRGRGLWKFNKSLLNNPKYCIQVKNCILDTIIDNPNTQDNLMWETVKCKIRGLTIHFASTEKRKRKNQIETLTTELIKVQTERDNTPEVSLKMENLLTMERDIKIQLDKHITHETEGAKLRSKTTYYEEGEKCTKFFIGLEKSRWEKKKNY